jgi:phage shock protein A
MEVMKRMLRVIRANLNSLVASREDPEMMLEKTFAQMQENLVQFRRGVAEAIATQKRTERQAIAARSYEDEWYRRAQLSLQQGNELLAREALTKRRLYQETATALFSQIEQQKEVVERLKQEMRSLELKINEVRTKKDMYIARARSAEASYRLQEMLHGLSDTSSLAAFERMEEKLIQIEAQSEAIAQISGENLERRFADLKSTNEIDGELAAMKNQMLMPPDTTQPDHNPQQST